MKELSLLTLNTVLRQNSPSKLHQKKKNIGEENLISVILTLLVLIYLVCIVPESNRVIALPSEAGIFRIGERRERCKINQVSKTPTHQSVFDLKVSGEIQKIS